MEIQPTELHERVPFFCGSYNMVEKEEFMYKAKLSNTKVIEKSPKNLGLFLFRIILVVLRTIIYRCFAISETKSSISVLLSTNKRASTTTTSTFL
jgi:hypothetical protein